jgi:hypothetical protein
MGPAESTIGRSNANQLALKWSFCDRRWYRQILWSFASGSAIHSSLAIVNAALYRGSGYSPNTAGTMDAFTPTPLG